MDLINQLRQLRAQKIEEAGVILTTAEGEKRDLNDDERGLYDGLVAEASALETRINRLVEHEARKAGLAEVRDIPIHKQQGPAQLKLGRGDSEIKAMAHYFRTGDIGGVSHLTDRDERGALGIVLNIPTAMEVRAMGGRAAEQRAVVDSTVNITTAADGSYLVPTGFVQDVAMRKSELMLAPRLGCRRVPGKGTTVNYPVEAADPEVFATTAEQADAYSVTYERDAGVVGIKAFTLVKKSRQVDLTEEILEDEDVGLMDYISGRIVKQIAGTHNSMLLTEVAASGTAFKTFASATAIAAGEPEDIVFHDTLSYYLDDDGAGAWVMRPSTFGDIASLTGNARLYAETPGGSFAREILGYPVYSSSKAAATAASAKDVYFGNWDYVGYREAPAMRFIVDPYSVDGLVILKYSFRAVYGVLQAGAIGYGVHPSA